MGSSGKKRTTMAKLNREARLRDKRVEKQTRRAARKSSMARDGAEAASRPEGLGTALAGLDGGRPDGPGPETVAAAAGVPVRGV